MYLDRYMGRKDLEGSGPNAGQDMPTWSAWESWANKAISVLYSSMTQ